MPTLHWIGKEKVVTHHQDVPYRVLEHKYGFRSDRTSKTKTIQGHTGFFFSILISAIIVDLIVDLIN